MKLGRDEGKVVTLTEKWRKSTIGKGISLREGEGGGKEMTFDDQRDILHFVLISFGHTGPCAQGNKT